MAVMRPSLGWLIVQLLSLKGKAQEHRLRLQKPEDDRMNFVDVLAYDATGSTITPSSYYFESGTVLRAASLCFDGQADTYCETDSTVDALVADYPRGIERVVVQNRDHSCCIGRAEGVVVQVSAFGEAKWQAVLEGAHASYTIDVPLATLRLQKREDDRMNFAEVLAYDATGSTITPSSYFFESGTVLRAASLCFDGQTDTYCETDSTVDALVAGYPSGINRVVVQNRDHSCCKGRADGVVATLHGVAGVKREVLVGAHDSYELFTTTTTSTTTHTTVSTTSTVKTSGTSTTSTSTIIGTATTVTTMTETTTTTSPTTSSTTTSTSASSSTPFTTTTSVTSTTTSTTESTSTSTISSTTDATTATASTTIIASVTSGASSTTESASTGTIISTTDTAITTPTFTSATKSTGADSSSSTIDTAAARAAARTLATTTGVTESASTGTSSGTTDMATTIPTFGAASATRSTGTDGSSGTTDTETTITKSTSTSTSSTATGTTSGTEALRPNSPTGHGAGASGPNSPGQAHQPQATTGHPGATGHNQTQPQATSPTKTTSLIGITQSTGTSSATKDTTMTTTNVATTEHPAAARQQAEGPTNAVSSSAATIAEDIPTKATTTTLPDTREAAEAVLSAVEGMNTKLLQQLSSLGNQTSVVQDLPGGATLSISRVGDLAKAMATAGEASHVVIDMPSTGVEVSLPLTMFSSLGIEGEVALSVTAFDPTSANIQGLGSDESKVAGAVVIDLYSMSSGNAIKVGGLTEPIGFSLPANFSTGMDCAYWDPKKSEWSSQGVWAAKNNTIGEKIRCQTRHLSLFGAIIKGIIETVECSTVLDLMTASAVHDVIKGDWLTTVGAIVTQITISFFLLIFVIGLWLDHRRHKNGHWQDGFLLVQEQPVAAGAVVPVADESESAGCYNYFTGLLCLCCVGMQDSQVLRDAIDDIFSNWFEYFSEVRTAIEECLSCIEADLAAAGFGLSMHHVHRAGHKVTSNLIITASRRSAAAALAFSDDLVSFVAEDEDLAVYLCERPTSGAECWRMAATQREAWAALRREVCESIWLEMWSQRNGRQNFAKTVTRLFLVQNPLSALFVADVFISCKLRVLILTCELAGAITVCCVFFEASGMAKGKARAGCSSGDDGFVLGETLGRCIVVSLSCLFIGSLPVQIMTSLLTKSFRKIAAGPEAREKQLKVWKAQEGLVRTIGVVYLTMCVSYTSLFLANIGDEDQQDWSITVGLAFLQDFVIFPFGTALMVPLMARMFLTTHTWFCKESREDYVRKVVLEFLENSNAMLPREAV